MAVRAPGGGRKRKPLNVHKLEGTYRGDRHGEWSPPKINHPLGNAPSYFNDEQRSIWDDAIMCIEAVPSMLSKLDENMLSSFVIAVYMHREATRNINLVGLLNAEGKPNGYANIIKTTSATIARIGAELGFSPIARERIKAKPPQPENPFGRLRSVA